MDHDASALNSAFLNFSSVSLDLDFMSTPLSNRNSYLDPEPFISSVLCDASCSSSIKPSANSHHQNCQKEIGHCPENPPLVYPGSIVQPKYVPLEFGESRKRWLIDQSCSIKDRLMIAIEYLKDYVAESDVLVQIWAPINRGGQYVLTTIDQPYFLNPNYKSLASYRNVSETFHLTAEENLKESAGLPGRVFLGKLPEWTPDVRFFRNDECPRKHYAKLYNISGCLALPVFEQDSGICLAVVEIVTTTQKISYHLEVEIICKALEAVDLKSSQDFFPLGAKAYNHLYQFAFPEISQILQSLCETFRLPLAVTWAICDRQGQSEHQKSEYCICTVDSACCVAENDLLGFLEACSEQYLFLDQGIVGKAFATNKQWFATDITSFSKANYPLSHHARIFNLLAAVAIPLQNMYTGLVEYVLEIFLPRDCKDFEEQKQMSNILPGAIQKACQSFHVIMDKELDDEVDGEVVVDLEEGINEEGIQKYASSPFNEPFQEESCWFPYKIDTQKKYKCAYLSWECPKGEPEDEFRITSNWNNDELDMYQEEAFSNFDPQSSMLKLGVDGREGSSVGQYSRRRAGEKRPTKTDKIISLQILQQYFAGSLKDAAKSIGVCPTTLKRICRQHGINRWPSRKIKKVNHSLRKLQLVVNSIRGAEDLIQIDSFYKTFPEFISPNDGEKGTFSSSKTSASIFGSTEAKQLKNTTSSGLKNECSLAPEDLSLTLQRTCSEAQLHSLNSSSLQTNTGKNLRDGVIFRVKATFGEENIRFSFLPNWCFRDLQKEIAKRFKIEDFTSIDLKYLDIDNESVLLTCDADLEECIDLLSLSPSSTIKINLHQSSQPIRLSSI